MPLLFKPWGITQIASSTNSCGPEYLSFYCEIDPTSKLTCFQFSIRAVFGTSFEFIKVLYPFGIVTLLSALPNELQSFNLGEYIDTLLMEKESQKAQP